MPNDITHSALISAGAKGQKLERALGLFQVMRDQGMVPDVITYIALTSACEKGQKAERALESFSGDASSRPGAQRHPLQRLDQCL